MTGHGTMKKSLMDGEDIKMKAPENMNVYHKKHPKGKEIILKKEPWVNEKYRKDYEGFLEEIFNLGAEVIEFASGGSSLYIAEKVKSLVTLEHDSVWHEVMQEAIAKEGISNITLYFDQDYHKNFHCEESSFDVAIVDVWEDPRRTSCIETAMNCLRSGGYLIFHNRVFIKRLKKEGWVQVKNWGKKEELPALNQKVAWRKPA